MNEVRLLTEALSKQNPDARLVFECGRDSTSEFEIKSLGPTEVRIIVAADSRVEVLEKEAQELEEYTATVARGVKNALDQLAYIDNCSTKEGKTSLALAISYLENVK